ncbi:oocyte zinc finger protein XlCOF6.1-like [Daphnia pulex]|uniref:oocyte zinc finger protein XlCOF6.1-like n=1 Tax=Daphnia pulex TaxID=6669 RepID=UPI001EE12DC1|nr:oocyte zinc finger protein XlCOF6.1-like [Daphnia pulex]
MGLFETIMATECSLIDFKEKIEAAVSMVPSMTAEEKLRAVQLWNILSEKLQEIVNSSAADINALSFQEPPASVGAPNFFFYPSSKQSQTQEENPGPFSSENNHVQLSNKFPIRESMETDNSLASFSDIQCADDESIHMDGMCPLTLPLSIEERSELTPSDILPDADKEKIKQFECTICGVSFRTKGHLLDHGRKHTGERPFHCTHCGSTFTTGSNLKRHVKSHIGDKTWTCLECGAKFLEKKTLLVHMRRHTGEKPYQCLTCNKRFSQLSILQSHMASHADQRCHLCELCGKSFRQKSQMKTHLLRHKGDEVKKYPCQECSMSFLTSSDFRRHTRVHTGERPFICDLCGKKFTRMETLNEHKNRHNGIKPFVCSICDKAFSEASGYGKHMKKHTAKTTESETLEVNDT